MQRLLAQKLRASVAHSGGIVMRRSMLAVVVAALAVVHGAQAKPAKAIHRLALAPGFSSTFPTASRAATPPPTGCSGNAPHLIVLEQVCAHLGLSKGGVMLVNMDRALPVTISTLFMPDFPITAEFFANPTADVTEVMSKTICSSLLETFKVESCSVRPDAVAGNAAFIADVVAVNPQKRRAAVRAYLVPDSSGVMAVAFFMPDPATPQTLALVERVAGSSRSRRVLCPSRLCSCR